MKRPLYLLIPTVLACAWVTGCQPQSPNSGMEEVGNQASAADPHAGHDHGPGEGHGEPKAEDEKAGAEGKAEGEKAAAAGGLAPGKGPWAQLAESKYKKTATGLVIAVMKEGNGATAEDGKNVSVHYTGWLKADGSKFDSSRDRNEPIEFPLGTGGVIPGWDQGVKGMKVGEQRQLVIPSDLAYGPSGRPGIPPSADLIFDVELVAVK